MKDTFYFPHDYNAKGDQRVLMLRAKFDGVAGYGLFFMCLESMAEEENGHLNRVAIGGLSVCYGVPNGQLEAFLNYCIEIGLFKEDVEGIFSERMIDHKTTRKVLKEAGKQGADKRWKNSLPIAPPNAKERKGKEIKEKEITYNTEGVDVVEKPKKRKGENMEVTNALSFLKALVGLDDFKEPVGTQRNMTTHFMRLKESIGKDTFIERLKCVLSDPFKAKNCNSIVYLYREVKSFIHSPKAKTQTTKKDNWVTF